LREKERERETEREREIKREEREREREIKRERRERYLSSSSVVYCSPIDLQLHFLRTFHCTSLFLSMYGFSPL
jgi:hypothetical protein